MGASNDREQVLQEKVDEIFLDYDISRRGYFTKAQVSRILKMKLEESGFLFERAYLHQFVDYEMLNCPTDSQGRIGNDQLMTMFKGLKKKKPAAPLVH